jgi:CHAD domain-containing protein
MVFMMEYMVAESHSSFMEVFAPASQTDITDEQYHEFRLELRRVKEANTHITQANFKEED